MKKISSLIIAGFLYATAMAQAPVPTAFNCDAPATPPSGWTVNTLLGGSGQTYTGSGQLCEGTAAAKLDFTGESISVNTATQPGRVVYSILGTGNTSWQGTFTIEESVDGSVWSALKTYGNGQLPLAGPCNYDSVLVTNANVRYVRFMFTAKTSGYNVAVDNIIVRAPILATQKIEVRQNTVQLVDGATSFAFNSPVATNTPVTFQLSNLGTGTPLSIDSVKITGTNAADFSIASPVLPTSIAALSSSNLVLNFTPASAGTRTAVMTIYSNDPTSDAVFVVNLYGSAGGFVSEPSAQATNMTFPVVKSYRLRVNFTAGTTDTYGGYLVLRSENGPVTGVPVDGTNYQVGETIGNAKVVYLEKPATSTASFYPRWVMANSTYHFAAFAYNGGNSPYVNYNTTAPLTANVTSSGSMVSPTEYSTVDENNPSFITQLQSVINPHTSIFYSNYRLTMIDRFMARDTLVVGTNTFTRVFNCSYSGAPVLYNEPFDFTATGTSREHSFPHSWMPTFPADSPEKPEYSDQHHLYPTIQSNVNDARCNYPFGEVVSPIITYQLGVMGLDTAGNRVYEPRDEHKGRSARALFYMTTCYNGIAGNQWNFELPIGEQCLSFQIDYPQNQELMKKWHFDHPPTNFDISRNDFLDSLQTNRNPFVDHPEWACYIDFSNMTYIANPTIPCTSAVGPVAVVPVENDVHFSIFPNPSMGDFNLNIYGANAETAIIKMMDMTGKTVISLQKNIVEGNNTIPVSISPNAGVYLVEVITSAGKSTKRIVIQ